MFRLNTIIRIKNPVININKMNQLSVDQYQELKKHVSTLKKGENYTLRKIHECDEGARIAKNQLGKYHLMLLSDGFNQNDFSYRIDSLPLETILTIQKEIPKSEIWENEQKNKQSA